MFSISLLSEMASVPIMREDLMEKISFVELFFPVCQRDISTQRSRHKIEFSETLVRRRMCTYTKDEAEQQQ